MISWSDAEMSIHLSHLRRLWVIFAGCAVFHFHLAASGSCVEEQILTPVWARDSIISNFNPSAKVERGQMSCEAAPGLRVTELPCRCQLHVAYSWLSFGCQAPLFRRLPAGRRSDNRPARRRSRSDWVIRRSTPMTRVTLKSGIRPRLFCLRSQKRREELSFSSHLPGGIDHLRSTKEVDPTPNSRHPRSSSGPLRVCLRLQFFALSCVRHGRAPQARPRQHLKLSPVLQTCNFTVHLLQAHIILQGLQRFEAAKRVIRGRCRSLDQNPFAFHLIYWELISPGPLPLPD